MKEDGAEFPNSNDNRETSDMAWRSVSNLTGLALYLTYARVSAMDRNTTTSDRRKDQQ